MHLISKMLGGRFKESIQAVLPVFILVIGISFLIGVPLETLGAFIIGTVLLVFGLTIFQIGANASMVTIAEGIGNFIVRKRKLKILILIAFLVGFLITVAEPALWVLSDQFKTVVSPVILILAVAMGVGVFVTLSLLRIVFQISLKYLILISYGIVFVIAYLVSLTNPGFIPIAFDSGGVTTGPMAVPFIMSLGYGLSHSRGDKKSEIDTFGLIGIASIGPIISVLILGLLNQPDVPILDTTSSLLDYFITNLFQMAVAILPFILFFFFFQMIAFRYRKERVKKIMIAFGYTYVGLVLFLTGANGGLVNLAFYIGEHFASTSYYWVLIPLGMLFGFLVISAEPSVIVLNKQVHEVSAGAIPQKLMMTSLSIGVSLAIGMSLLRVITGISIWYFILPGYLIAIALMFFTPAIFSGIAFDSGGAVSGAMTSAFLVPFALGAATALGSNILTDAFGLVSLVAMTPLITIQILGFLYQRRQAKVEIKTEPERIIKLSEVEK